MKGKRNDKTRIEKILRGGESFFGRLPLRVAFSVLNINDLLVDTLRKPTGKQKNIKCVDPRISTFI